MTRRTELPISLAFDIGKICESNRSPCIFFSALTEKIVKALKRMKCPFALEPHQIQGMDSIHIFPVIQWLVKMSIQYRQENEAYMKSYAVRMFNKDHKLSIVSFSESDHSLNTIARSFSNFSG